MKQTLKSPWYWAWVVGVFAFTWWCVHDRPWPPCGPRFTIVEQTLQGQTKFWLRKGDGKWPFCENVLQSGYFVSADEARAAAVRRLQVPDTEERTVGRVD